MKSQILQLPLLLLLLLNPFYELNAQQEDFKIVGYFPYYRFGYADQINFEQLTHVNISFANPNYQGYLGVGGEDIDPIVDRAHDGGAEVFIALAGGALTTDWAEAWDWLLRPQNRTTFISKIIDYVFDHDLDGVDVDLEWGGVDENYSGFVIELADSLHFYGLPISAALPGVYRFPEVTDEALATFDFINVMAYNFTGPWDPDNEGQHSSYNNAVSSINYWVNQGVPKSRLTLGVPFYGYTFSGGSATSFTYRTMVDMDSDNAFVDQVGSSYYNGIPTIQQKTTYAKNQLSGIMIWEIGQDAFNEYSLLNAINEVISTDTENISVEHSLKVYPQPAEDFVHIQYSNEDNATMKIMDMQGVLVGNYKLHSGTNTIDISLLRTGMYVGLIQTNTELLSFKLIKNR